MSDERRARRLDERSELRLRVAQARARLERVDAHMVFDERGGTNDRLEANAINFANAIRDALDLLNNVPNGYWKKYPAEYNKIVKIKDL